MRQKGAVFVLALLGLFLAMALGMGVAFLRVQTAVAARERALLNVNQARLSSAQTDLDLLLATLSDRGRAYLEGASSRTPPYLSSLNNLVAQLQAEADALTCTPVQDRPDFRIYFGTTACGQGLPSDMDPPPPPSLRRLASGAEVYEVPFVGLAVSTSGENRRTQSFRGSLRFLVGSFPPSVFQGFFVSASRSDGSRSFFDGGQVWDGPVYVSAPPNFGKPLGPHFLGGFSTALCPAPSGNSCPSGRGRPYFLVVGAVDPPSLYPSPLRPCYATSCPTFGGGVDWNAPPAELPPPSLTPTVEVSTASGRARVSLELATLPDGTSGQGITVTAGGTTARYLASASRTWLQVASGENLLAQATQSPVGWTRSCGEPLEVADGQITSRCRDLYYGNFTPTNASYRTWRVSFRANADSATGCVQVGLQVQHPSGVYWYGSLWEAGVGVCPGEGWKTVTTTITLPSDITALRPWVQINDNPPHSGAGTAIITDLSLTPSGFGYALDLGGPPVFRFAGSNGVAVSGPPDRPAWHSAVSTALVSQGPLLIEGNLLSSAPPCRSPAGVREEDKAPYPADCGDTGLSGILSLISEEGDVRISPSTPPSLHLHAAIYAPQGAFGPESLPMDLRALYLQGALAVRFFDDLTDASRQRGWLLFGAHDPRLLEISPPGWPRLPWGVWGAWARATWENK